MNIEYLVITGLIVVIPATCVSIYNKILLGWFVASSFTKNGRSGEGAIASPSLFAENNNESITRHTGWCIVLLGILPPDWGRQSRTAWSLGRTPNP